VSSDPDDLITVYEAENVTEAYLVKNVLVDEGIEAVVAGEHEPFSINITPTEVLVKRKDEQRARKIIAEYDAEQERRADRPDWVCPACGATVIGAFDECDACGADRPGTEDS
jgi:rubrerythrin